MKAISTLSTLCLALLSLLSSLQAQVVCDGQRYRTRVFADTLYTPDILYGRAAQTNPVQIKELRLDLYQPAGDTAALRPLVVVQHGGTFVTGSSRDVGVRSLCDSLAHMGYVVASINYRLQFTGYATTLPPWQKDSILAAAVRGTQDVKTAVRFFVRSAVNGNPYRIDTQHIYLMGESAGAVACLNALILKNATQFSQLGDMNILTRNGGLDGTGGSDADNHTAYPFRARAGFSICGALGRASWMAPGDPPIFSLHAVNDNVVNYKSAEPGALSGIFTGPALILDGSFIVDSLARTLGNKTALLTWPSGGHVPYQNLVNATQRAYMRDVVDFTTLHLYDGICQNFTQRQQSALSSPAIRLYPNPAHDALQLELATPGYMRLVDLQGRQVLAQQLPAGASTVRLPELRPGLYVAHITHSGGSWSQRVQLQ